MNAENAIITNTPTIKLNDSFFQFEIEEASISIDMRALFNTQNYSESAWINITPILQSSWSPVKKTKDWLRNSKLKEYINIIHREIFKGSNLRDSSKAHNSGVYLGHAPKSQWLKADWLEDGETPLILTRRGNGGGTWLHKEMFIEFITTLRADYRRELHKMVMEIVKTADTMKISRVNTKVLFAPLTDIIKEKYIPAQPSDMRKYAYSELLDLVNLSALGMTSKAYQERNGLTKAKIKEDGNISIRDYMNKTELEAIESKEQELWLLIKHVSTDFNFLKARLI